MRRQKSVRPKQQLELIFAGRVAKTHQREGRVPPDHLLRIGHQREQRLVELLGRVVLAHHPRRHKAELRFLAAREANDLRIPTPGRRVSARDLGRDLRERVLGPVGSRSVRQVLRHLAVREWSAKPGRIPEEKCYENGRHRNDRDGHVAKAARPSLRRCGNAGPLGPLGQPGGFPFGRFPQECQQVSRNG